MRAFGLRSTKGDDDSADDHVTNVPYSECASGVDVDAEDVRAEIVRLIGRDKTVLDLGPATGHLAEALCRRGCKVTAIAIDSDAAERASKYCERVLVGDLDTLDLEAELAGHEFDAIVADDVLGHVRDPARVLRGVKSSLAQGAHLVVSATNIAHGSVRLALLQGHFDYQPRGLLDDTHVRFFTRQTLDELLRNAGFFVATRFCQEREITLSEVPFDTERLPEGLLANLGADEDARTYRFVIDAYAVHGDEGPLLLRLEEQQEQRDLEHRFAELQREHGELRRRLLQAEGALADSDAALLQHRAWQEAQAKREEALRISLLDAEGRILELEPAEVELANMASSRAWRVVTALQLARRALTGHSRP